MRFLELLGHAAWLARTPWLLAALLITAALVRRVPRGRRPRLRLPGSLALLHVVMLVVSVVQQMSGYDAHAVDLTSLAFSLLSAIALAIVVLFRLTLPTVGVEVPRILVDIVGAAAVVVAMIAVGKRAGFSVTGLITTSAVLTAVIGFSMQDTLGNLIGGLALQLDNSIRVGDWVNLGPGQPYGKVTEIRWRYTAIETRNWETIIVPNSTLMKNPMTVLGKRSLGLPYLRRSVEFYVDYRTPPTDVIKVVQDAMRADPLPRASSDPLPVVIFAGMRDSFAVYWARYWLADLESDDGADSEVRIRLFYALGRAGIPLSIPAQAVFVTEESPEREHRKIEEERDRRVTAIDRVDLFHPIQGELRQRLATALRHAPFSRGETVAREGDSGDDALYVIVRGEASVRLGGVGGRQVAQLGPGQFFGEMALMTGEKRSATVVATSDLVCYRLDKSAFEHVLREHPDIAEEVAEVLMARRAQLEVVKDELDDVRRRRLQTEKDNLLGRIRGFFNLFDDNDS